MALTDFKVHYSNTYQEIFPKVLVAMKIANTRFEPTLSYGDSVVRAKYDISSVRVRSVTTGSDRTIDPITDSEETLTIDRKYGTTFPLSVYEKKQAGPLNPGAVIGKQVAIKLATFVDADVLYETVNATYDFDNGDLTTLASTGTGITLSSTTVPQMATRMGAKLRRQNQTLENLCFVTDSYALADISQYLLGKNYNVVEAIYKNGFVDGDFGGAEVYVSENLTGEAVLSLATQPTANDTVTIGGVTLTFVSSIGSNPGNVLIGANVDATRVNLAGIINDPATTSATQVALSAANQVIFTDTLRLTATDSASANTLTLVGKGSGRLVLSAALTDGTDTWTKNVIHSYFGKKGAIDVVIQEEVDMEMRDEPKQRTTNIFSDVMYGVKTFSDGAAKFLDVLINA